MRRYTFLALILVSFSNSTSEPNLPKFVFPNAQTVVVDSKEMLKSQPPLIALNLSEGSKVTVPYDFKSQGCDLLDKKNYENFVDENPKQDFKLSVIIDTTANFYSKGIVYKNIYRKEIESPFVEILKETNALRNQNVKALPVFIYNNSNKSNYIKTYGNYTHPNYKVFLMIQEAKDKNGVWKPIEYAENISYEPSGSLYYELQPKTFLVTAMIKYKGNFKTKIRVKIAIDKKVFYSNEINGTINYSQFDVQPIKEFLRTGEYEQTFESVKDELFLNFKKN